MLQTRHDSLGERFQLQRTAFEAQPFPDFGVRKDRLKRLLAVATERRDLAAPALRQDVRAAFQPAPAHDLTERSHQPSPPPAH
ncbi:hypothetical protein NKI38_00050 [Mesorhizobium sp. M0621]|uniref:hypothetical protein n=1 Tax=Mesorhizobium sp. M0621 TaxID=2956974 RepID=UPI00333AEFD3